MSDGIDIPFNTDGCEGCDYYEKLATDAENAVTTLQNGKQDKLTAGEKITITGDRISLECCSLEELKGILHFDPSQVYTGTEFSQIIINALRGAPVILGVVDTSIWEGDTFDPRAGITAVDHDGNDLTASIVISGTVDPDTPGTYTLTYSVTDSHSLTTTATRTVIVQPVTLRTTLFTDGTLLLNERSSDRDANVLVHGAVVHDYAPAPYTFTYINQQPWVSSKNLVTKVEVAQPFTATNLGYWFAQHPNLVTADFTGMTATGVTNARNMFEESASLTTVSGLTLTSAVTTVREMFDGCTALTSVSSANWDLSSATTAQRMFYGCQNLVNLDVSNWGMTACQDMSYMFDGCRELTALNTGSWTPNNITTLRNTFYNCRKLAVLDVSNFKTGNCTDMRSTFNNCRVLPSVNLGGWDTSNVTEFFGFAYYCQGFSTLDVSSFDTRKAENMRQMFAYTLLSDLDLRNFNTPALTNTYQMFANSPNLTTIYASTNFDVSGVTDSTEMFLNCPNLVGGAGTVYDFAYKDKVRAHIDGGVADPGYFTS